MNKSDKSRMLMVLAANLLLSTVVGVAIVNQKNGADKSAKLSDKQSLQKSALIQSERNLPNANQPNSDSQKDEVLTHAKLDAGRNDPMSEDGAGAEVFSNSSPRQNRNSSSRSIPVQTIRAGAFVPPPPPLESMLSGSNAGSIIPAAQAYTNPVKIQGTKFRSEPNEPIYKTHGIKVSGIIGNRAILIMRQEGSRRTDRPEAITMSVGEEIRTINKIPVSIESVEKDRVTFKVAGQLCVKSLPDIR